MDAICHSRLGPHLFYSEEKSALKTKCLGEICDLFPCLNKIFAFSRCFVFLGLVMDSLPSNLTTFHIHQIWCLAQFPFAFIARDRKFLVNILSHSGRFSSETLRRQTSVSLHLAKKQKSPEATGDAARLLPNKSSTARCQHAVNGEKFWVCWRFN